jgi:para-aminobenzoate synthetase/4-amino-4-deoxychorismate lyase
MNRSDPAAGVFDTILVQDGWPVSLTAHLGRLAGSVRALYGVVLDRAELETRVRSAASGHHLARVRIGYTTATGPEVVPTTLTERPRSPWHLVVRRVPGGWGEHKWQDRAALAAGPDPDADPLLVDEDDLLLETGRGNVFVVRLGEVATPPLDGRILPGVSRATVLELLADAGVPCQERSVPLAALGEADEVFVTNAIGGVRPVATVDGVGAWAAGPVTRAADASLERCWRDQVASRA